MIHPALAFSGCKPHAEACVSFSYFINGDLDNFGMKNCMVCITVLLNNLEYLALIYGIFKAFNCLRCPQ